MQKKRVFISADHGLSLIYFLQSDVVTTLLESDIEVVMLTEDALVGKIKERFAHPGMSVEGLRVDQTRRYFEEQNHSLQYWLHFLRWMGGSKAINTNPMDGHMRQMDFETSRGGKLLMPFIKLATAVLRRSAAARKALVRGQMRFTPSIYTDLFEKYQPDLVVASTPGWRFDRYLLREAAKSRIPRAAAIVGWDNPSSYRLPGAPMDYATCWSEIQKDELVRGSDWAPERVNIGGIPTYDGYFRRQWQMSREDYYALHGLDPNRKLLAYASSFVTFSPNYPNIEALARLVSSDSLREPCQLLIRLHPNHFMSGSLYEQEANRVRDLVRSLPYVHLVEPVPLGDGLSYYSGEDMPEKSSMMAYADVFLTVYSTMVVETAVHNRPIVSVCIDTPGGWNTPGKFSLSLAEIAEWPTHQRFREAGAGRVAFNAEQVREAVNFYLENPLADEEARRKFIEREVTFTDGSAGRRTGEYLASLVKKL
ncbi:MAG: hypothetical protein ACYC3H_07810 [Bellilinea sp.]